MFHFVSPVGGIINFWLMFVEYEVWKTGEYKSECEGVCKCEYRSEGLDFDGGCFASKVEVPAGVSPVNISPVRWMIVQGLR